MPVGLLIGRGANLWNLSEMKSIISFLLLLAVSLPIAAHAASQYIPAPPGQIVQTANLNFGGATGGGLYAAVTSRKLLSKAGSTHPQYQPYLTIYRQNPEAGTLKQIYQSPSATDDLKLVPRRAAIPNVLALWMPGVEVNIIGAGSLMETGTQQLVVSVYEFAADCGQVTLHVLRMDAKSQKLQDALQVQNFCKLDGSVSGHSLLLDGPYYAKGAALCCPTKNDAHAVVIYSVASRSWSETPPYFKLIPGTTSASPSTETSNAPQPQTMMTCSVIHSRRGQSFTITLPSNRTTGYEWQLDTQDTAPSIKMLSTRYDAPGSNLMGAPGHEVWTFKTQQSGDLLLGMRYVRPFDKPSVAPAKEAFFVVVVR